MRSIYLYLLLIVFIACKGQDQKMPETKIGRTAVSVPGDMVREGGREVRDILRDSKNNLWFASNGEGVFKYDGRTILQFTEKQGLCSNYVWNVMEGKDGKIWFKTGDGVCFFDGINFTTQPVQQNILAAADASFLGSDLLVEYYYNGKSLQRIQLPETSPLENIDHTKFHYDIYCTFKDSKGNTWFGTCTAGVCKYDGKTYTWLNDKELAMPVRSIFEDRQGNIWIGNNGYGLFRYDGATLTNITKEKHLENPDFVQKLGG